MKGSATINIVECIMNITYFLCIIFDFHFSIKVNCFMFITLVFNLMHINNIFQIIEWLKNTLKQTSKIEKNGSSFLWKQFFKSLSLHILEWLDVLKIEICIIVIWLKIFGYIFYVLIYIMRWNFYFLIIIMKSFNFIWMF